MNDKIRSFIPLDKSWIIRMGIMDMLYGDSNQILKVLDSEPKLCDDLVALRRVIENWDKSDVVDVGESGTIYRLLLFINWKFELNKEFITHGTLTDRNITNRPDIVNLSQEELLNLDSNTSQWASASVICGDKQRIDNPPFKLDLMYEAWDYWHAYKAKGDLWETRKDNTIKKQAEAYLGALSGQNIVFSPEQAEDYPFSYVFNLLSEKQGLKLWPSLRGHESDRISEVTNMLGTAKDGGLVTSNDHRVVQSIAMWAEVNKQKVSFTNPNCVNKSWPEFWDFILASRTLVAN